MQSPPFLLNLPKIDQGNGTVRLPMLTGDTQNTKWSALPIFWTTVVTWRDRREGPSSILRLGPSYTIAEFNRRVNLRFCIDHRIAMAKKWRVKESEWILAGVFKKMRCDLFCFLFFSSKIYLTLTYSYFEKYYCLPPLILNGKTTWGDKLFFFTNIKTDGFESYDKVLLK